MDPYHRALGGLHSQMPPAQLHTVLPSPQAFAGRAGGLRWSNWKSTDLAIRRPTGHLEWDCSVAMPTRA